MSNSKIVCKSEEIDSGGIGYKFHVTRGGMAHPAFVVRFKNSVYGYLNRCAHLMLQLDYGNSEFFDTAGEYLVCCNHGAMYEPDTGLCINGPCYGGKLIQLSMDEQDGYVVLADELFVVCDAPESTPHT